MVDLLNDDQVSATRNASADLTWDYSAHEASPLLRNTVSALQRSKQKLTTEQLSYLVDSLDEVSRVLRAQLSPSVTHPHKFPRLKKFACIIPFVFCILHISAVIFDSIASFQRYYPTYVATSIGILLVLIFHVEKWLVARPRIPPLSSIIISIALTTLLFSSLYTIAHPNLDSMPYWSLYLACMHASISVTSINYYSQFPSQTSWIPTLLSLQMLTAIIHLVLLTATLTKGLGRRSSADDEAAINGGDDNDDDDLNSYQTTYGRIH